MAAAAPAPDAKRQKLLDMVASRQANYDQASAHGRDYGDKGTMRTMLNLAQRALADYDAKAKAPAAAPKPAAAAAPAVVTPIGRVVEGAFTPAPSPKPPAAVADPEASIAPTIAAATDRADVALQQPIAAPVAKPGQPAVEETEAETQRRKLAQRAFLGRTTGILTSVSGAAPSGLQIGVRKLLGGTA